MCPPKPHNDRPSAMDEMGRRHYRGYFIQKKLTGKWNPTHTYHVMKNGKLIAQCVRLQEAIDWITDKTGD